METVKQLGLGVGTGTCSHPGWGDDDASDWEEDAFSQPTSPEPAMVIFIPILCSSLSGVSRCLQKTVKAPVQPSSKVIGRVDNLATSGDGWDEDSGWGEGKPGVDAAVSPLSASTKISGPPPVAAEAKSRPLAAKNEERKAALAQRRAEKAKSEPPALLALQGKGSRVCCRGRGHEAWGSQESAH